MIAPEGGVGGGGGANPFGGGGRVGTGLGGSILGRGGNAGSGVRPDAGDGTCQEEKFTFDPKIPTVFVLVDRSGSEFDSSTNGTTGTYYALRAATLQVIEQLQHDVRFGFGAFVGAGGGMCKPVFDSVPIALDNSAAIAAAYNSLSFLSPWGTKADTPASDIIPMVKSILHADSGMGDKYLLLVTDSETDFCDDGSAICPADALIYRIQDLYTANIKTLVIALPEMTFSQISASVLQGLANAGTGKVVALPSGINTAGDINDQCNGRVGWKSLWTSAGLTGHTAIAAYGTPGGNAAVFTPTSASQAALTAQLSAALYGVKSCVFDLNGLEHPLKVNLDLLDRAHVLIQGVEIPLGTGWQMDSPTKLELIGDGCATWRKMESTMIDFQFPCEVVIPG